MTSNLTVNLLRGLFLILCGFLGSAIGGSLLASISVGIAVGLIFGLSIILADRLLNGVSLRIFSSATFGLLLGCVFAQLLLASGVLVYLPGATQWLIGLTVYLTFAYLGMMLAIRSHRDEFAIIIPFIRFRRSRIDVPPLIIDSNICIDARILPLARTGFISSNLLVPGFVLAELQLLADSSDPGRRERGRRGLDALKCLQEMPEVECVIHETEEERGVPVDTRIIQLAQLMACPILTNDVNLAKSARLRKVEVLVLTEVEGALRGGVSVGDSIQLDLVKEGRDPGQAIGYLTDGTMIVVNKAARSVGQAVTVKVSSIVPTAGGKLVFAEVG